eukprot:365907-Chlamydomonas_euryale.AAC.6
MSFYPVGGHDADQEEGAQPCSCRVLVCHAQANALLPWNLAHVVCNQCVNNEVVRLAEKLGNVLFYQQQKTAKTCIVHFNFISFHFRPDILHLIKVSWFRGVFNSGHHLPIILNPPVLLNAQAMAA